MTTSILPLADQIKAEKGASRRWSFIFFFLTAILAAGGYFVWRQTAANSAAKINYATQPVQRDTIRIGVTATGNLQPTNKVTVGSELSGTTKEVYVNTNDKVTRGQMLAKLDTSKLEQQTESSRATATAARAKVAQTQATVIESEASLARLKKLKEASGGKLPSQADMDAAIANEARAKADLASAQAEVKQAEANVGTNESDLAKSIVKSPIDGIVLTRSLEPGQTVAATMTAPELFVVAEKLENMKLEVAVAEADIARVAAGQSANFTVDAWPNRTFKAKVKKVEFGSVITDNVVTYKTELEVSNDDLSLRPGMTATAEISVAVAENVLVVPNAALRFDPAQAQAPSGVPTPGKSFLQSLIPSPGRRMPAGGGKPTEQARTPSAGAEAKIWVLSNGSNTPTPLTVKTGLTNGRVTEVSGEGVSPDLQVIVHADAVNL